MSFPPIMTIAHGVDRVSVNSRGGAILEWRHANRLLLAPAAHHREGARHPIDCASFPLVPYSNRIAQGRFRWASALHHLRLNILPEPHAIHGVGWIRDWTFEDHRSDSLTLHLDHSPDEDWPWPFSARQTITVGDGELILNLEATNQADSAVPLAFGHHPYFPAQGAQLEFRAERVWLKDRQGLPSETAIPAEILSFENGAPVAGREVDHCYEGWDGTARISWRDHPGALEVRASPSLPCAVVYIPTGEDRFCFEPVPHAPNSVNRTDAIPVPVVKPGDTFTSRIAFRIVSP